MPSIEDIGLALDELGLGAHVVVHSSLRSFGGEAPDAEALVEALRQRFETVMMPAFSFSSNAPPPAGDHPTRNGTDYSFYAGWSRSPVPFVVERAEVDPKMGLLARRFAASTGVLRSDHPWHSWAAAGPLAAELVRDHYWASPNLPLERLARRPAHVLLLGVGLSACTALHIAEERAGRRPFIRWATDRQGGVRRMAVAGCAKGFDALTPACEPLLTRRRVGSSTLMAAPLGALIEKVTSILSTQPELTRCSEHCARCKDAIEGGPDA